MRKAVGIVAAGLTLVLPLPAPAAPGICDLGSRFMQRDPDGPRTVLFSHDVLLFSAQMRVDADGGPHAYSAKDPDGTLCNPTSHPENRDADPIALGCAMDSICDGAKIQLPSQKVLDAAACPALSKAFRFIRDSGWNPPRGYALLPVGIEMASPNHPCLDADATYIVSPSSTPSGVNSGKRCDQSNYVDTLLPSIVVPKCWSTAYRSDPKHRLECADRPAAGVEPAAEVGDLVALHGRQSGTMSYAIVGDLGPNDKLGEASVGLLMLAAGRKDAPTYLKATDSLDRLEQFDVVIFKGTRYSKLLTTTNAADMARVAQAAFQNWGGDLDTAKQRLIACGLAASPRAKPR